MQNFLRTGLSVFAQRNLEMAIFIEPRLESGFPDLVICVFDRSIYSNWEENRSKIKNNDLKLLQHLSIYGNESFTGLTQRIGGIEPMLTQSLTRLQRSGLAQEDAEGWTASPLDCTFAIRDLIAIEAKINSWKSGLRQAHLNTWFASRSFLLVPRNASLDRIYSANPSALGVLVQDEEGTILAKDADTYPLPSSYVSWLFNEWIGRSLNR